MRPDPTRVLVAGDWHANLEWSVGVIEQLPKLLPDEDEPLILHLGDFGLWPGYEGMTFLEDVEEALMEHDAQLWFVDGNHDATPEVDALLRRGPREDGRVRVQTDRSHWNGQRIHYLPRAHRWRWHGRTWLALGGATSVDHRARVLGRSWWPGEAIALADTYRATEPGPADVMVCHDAPDGVPMDLPDAPDWWDMEPAHRHRELLGRVVDEVRPSWLMHGHYHVSHETTVQRSYGPLRVTGLDRDGALSGAHRVLNIETMEWET